MLPKVAQEKLDLPRMSDFALLGEAIARSYGLAPGWFISVFKAKQQVAVRNAVAADPLCGALTSFLIERPGRFVRTVMDLGVADAFQSRVSKGNFPETGHAFTGLARRIEATLRFMGIGLTKVGERWSRETIWELKAISQARW